LKKVPHLYPKFSPNALFNTVLKPNTSIPNYAISKYIMIRTTGKRIIKKSRSQNPNVIKRMIKKTGKKTTERTLS
jgi:hypothetical protein